MTPSERYELPQSSGQEYGFASVPLVPKSTVLEPPRRTCEETRYASTYYALSGGLTPFSKGDRGTPNAAKKT
jgi:hypothetical protein